MPYLETKVSIGMPVFNDKAFLESAINSILSQSFTDFELIISDDCSTDGSQNICKQYVLKDARVSYIRQEKNIGISKNMEFLLSKASGRYFMWAANDDKWDKDFIKILKNNLDSNPLAISSFCIYSQIDENDNLIEGRNLIIEDYSGQTKYERLLKLIKKKSDGFGYGLFLRSEILGVRFPVWWGINRKCAYNNIYPSLCFYLTKGDYIIYKKEPLWFNTVKLEKNINHKIPFSKYFILCYMAFAIRKINLIFYCLFLIIKAENGLLTALRILPHIFFSWFIIPVFFNLPEKFKIFKTDKSVFI